MLIIIPIQSLSDIITNSSSEIFCTIYSEEHLYEIYRFLKAIIKDDYDDDCISMSLRNKDEDYLDDDYYKNYPESWIEINIPYGYGGITEILEVGLKSILEVKFKDKYKIVFE